MIWRYANASRELLHWIQTRIDLLFTMSENPQAFMRMKASEYIMRANSVELSDDSVEAQARVTMIIHLVEPDGIEPTTSCLQSTRSPS